MEQSLDVEITIAFEDATNRKITFKGVDEDSISDVKIKVKRLNTNMPEDFKRTFVSPIGAQATLISKAVIVSRAEEMIYNGQG